MTQQKKGGLVFSFKHRPPLSVTIISSILLLLTSSKSIIIDSLPIRNADALAILGSWYVWLLNVLGVVMGIVSIVLGVDKSPSKPDTDNP